MVASLPFLSIVRKQHTILKISTDNTLVKYNVKSFNKLSNNEEPTHEEEPKPEIKPEAKPQPKKEEVDNTSRYIALFRDGLIGKEEFLKLTTDTNHNQNEPSVIYQ